MGPGIFARLFTTENTPLCYVSSLNGTPFARQWTVYRGAVAELGVGGGSVHEIEFLLELDLAAIGQGPQVLHHRSRLRCDDTLRPLDYISQGSGMQLRFEFDEASARVRLPDGSLQTIGLAGARFLAEANLTGQQALMLLPLGERLWREETHTAVFLINQLLVAPYRTTPAPDLPSATGHWLRSSHEEELWVDDHGLLLIARTPSQGIEAQRVVPPPPLPQWQVAEALPQSLATYSPPSAAGFVLEEVDVPSAISIGAALSLPSGQGPFPAVLFLAGSGRHDRHGIAGEIDLGTHEILDGLAARGVAGLRYDSRGAGRTAAGPELADEGLEPLFADARAALRYLRGRPEIDPRRIVLIGHSQGGLVAARLAHEEGAAIAGLVLLAAPGRGIDEILADQTLALAQRAGLSPEQAAAQLAKLRELVALIDSERPWQPDEIPDHLYLHARSRRWFLDHLRNRTADLLRSLQVPILILQGDKDYQVSAELDYPRLVQAASAAGREVSHHVLPGLDHLFKPVPKEAVPQDYARLYYDRSRRVAPVLVETLAAWLQDRRSPAPAV